MVPKMVAIIRCVLLLIILTTTSNANGQDLLWEKASNSKIKIGLSYALDTNRSSQRLEVDQYKGYSIKYPQNNFTAGLDLQYFMLRHFAFHSGISYSYREFDGRFYCENCFYVGSYRPQKFALQFLQVPTAVKYYPYKNKIGVFGELGLMNQLMLDKSYNLLEGNTYSISVMLGAGVSYSVGHGLTAQLSAKYTDGLSEIFKEADYSYEIVGVQLSVLKQL